MATRRIEMIEMKMKMKKDDDENFQNPGVRRYVLTRGGIASGDW